METASDQWKIRFLSIAVQAGQDDGAHGLQHLNRVWQTALLLLAPNAQADRLVVQAACFLHDLVNLPKDHPDRAQASRLSALRARTALRQIDFPASKIEAVEHAIEAHSFTAAIAARTIEAKLVQDADRLDALGAIGLARLFYTAGRMGSALAHPTDPLGTNRVLDDRAFALDHIMVKLEALPGSMQTAAGRELGRSRFAGLLVFRDQFVAQWKQGLE